MADAVEDATALLEQRQEALKAELDRIEQALTALKGGPTMPDRLRPAAPVPPRYNSARDTEPDEDEGAVRGRVREVLEEKPVSWTPADMAQKLGGANIKTVRTAFWSLRKHGAAKSMGAGRSTRTYAAKWRPSEVVNGDLFEEV